MAASPEGRRPRVVCDMKVTHGACLIQVWMSQILYFHYHTIHTIHAILIACPGEVISAKIKLSSSPLWTLSHLLSQLQIPCVLPRTTYHVNWSLISDVVSSFYPSMQIHHILEGSFQFQRLTVTKNAKEDLLVGLIVISCAFLIFEKWLIWRSFMFSSARCRCETPMFWMR